MATGSPEAVRFRLPRRSFRTRLTLTITAVFVAAGAALLIVQNILVSKLFDGAISSTTMAISVTGVSAGPVTSTLTGGGVAGMAVDSAGAGGYVIAGQAVPAWFDAQSQTVAGDVRSGLMLWSVVTLVGFTVLATGLAWWLARRSMRRIGEVTAMAKDLSTHDLDRRLDLPGPRDEIKELADTFDAMLDRLEDSFARQDRFVANASHELRTPLTTARTALEIPLAQNRIPADLRPAIRTALRAGEQSENLISSLLVLARGSTVTEPTETDLDELVSDTVIETRLRWPDEVDVRLTTAAAPVSGEPTMLSQAIGNLIDNALLHNVPGGRVWVDVGVAGGEAVLQVENTGPEVSPDDLALLGEPFYRGGASRTAARRPDGRGGVGLGLSIVMSIIKAHRGTLSMARREGGGLKVTVRLPLAVDTARR